MSDTSKEELALNIKEWIKIDSEIAQFKLDIKERTNKKKLLTENLVTVMKTNKIDCFDINILTCSGIYINVLSILKLYIIK